MLTYQLCININLYSVRQKNLRILRFESLQTGISIALAIAVITNTVAFLILQFYVCYQCCIYSVT